MQWIPGRCSGAPFDPSDAGTLSLQVSCLCGSAPCLLCGCCPSAKNSTISRLLFTFFLFLGTLVSIIMIIPGVEKELHKVSNSRRSLGLVTAGKMFGWWWVHEAESAGEFLGHDVACLLFFSEHFTRKDVINPRRGRYSGII